MLRQFFAKLFKSNGNGNGNGVEKSTEDDAPINRKNIDKHTKKITGELEMINAKLEEMELKCDCHE